MKREDINAPIKAALRLKLDDLLLGQYSFKEIVDYVKMDVPWQRISKAIAEHPKIRVLANGHSRLYIKE